MNVAKEILHWCRDMRYTLNVDRSTAEYIANKWRMQAEAKERKAEIERLRNGKLF